MKTKDIVKEAAMPSRIRLGAKNQTAPNPALVKGSQFSNQFVGKNADKHKFVSRVQVNNYERIKQILKRNGLQFNHFFASTFRGSADYTMRYSGKDPGANLETFIGVVGDINNPQFVWWKYEGGVAGGGRNLVYAGGQPEKLTNLLLMPTDKQDAFVTQSAQGTYTPKSSATPKKYTVRFVLLHPAWGEKHSDYWADNEKDSKFRKIFLVKLTARNTVEAEKLAGEKVQRMYPEKIAQLLKQGFAPSESGGRFGTVARIS